MTALKVLSPFRWTGKTNLDITRDIGTGWLRSTRSLCLAVPSVIVPEMNYLINPAHRDFKLVAVKNAQPYQYDSRLFEVRT
jgi:hypothetical protein